MLDFVRRERLDRRQIVTNVDLKEAADAISSTGAGTVQLNPADPAITGCGLVGLNVC